MWNNIIWYHICDQISNSWPFIFGQIFQKIFEGFHLKVVLLLNQIMIYMCHQYHWKFAKPSIQIAGPKNIQHNTLKIRIYRSNMQCRSSYVCSFETNFLRSQERMQAPKKFENFWPTKWNKVVLVPSRGRLLRDKIENLCSTEIDRNLCPGAADTS